MILFMVVIDYLSIYAKLLLVVSRYSKDHIKNGFWMV